MNITVSTIEATLTVDTALARARFEYERARDHHDYACARRDALAHQALLFAVQHGYSLASPEMDDVMSAWHDARIEAGDKEDKRRAAVADYTQALDTFIDSVRTTLSLGGVQR